MWFKKSGSEKGDVESTWPPINELIWIRLPCCETYVHPSRVEDYADGNLVLAAPSKPHLEQVPAPNPDRRFLIGWREGLASKQVMTQLVASSDGEVPTWTVRSVAPPEIVQRRRFVRANWNGEVTLYLPLGPVTGTAADMSEAGIRCEIPVTNEPRSGSTFEIGFELDGAQVLLEAEVAWWGQPVANRIEVGLQFASIAPTLGDRIRAHVFSLQVAERRDRLG